LAGDSTAITLGLLCVVGLSLGCSDDAAAPYVCTLPLTAIDSETGEPTVAGA
jgi:hypothetical protein